MLGFGLQTAFEIILVVAVFWGIFHEDKLIKLEKKLFAAIRRRRIRLVKSGERSTSFRVLETGR